MSLRAERGNSLPIDEIASADEVSRSNDRMEVRFLFTSLRVIALAQGDGIDNCDHEHFTIIC